MATKSVRGARVAWLAVTTLAAGAGSAAAQDCRTTMVSLGTSGTQISMMPGDGGWISDDGSRVVFHLLDFNHPLSPQHAWVHDAKSGVATMLDVLQGGGAGNRRTYSCDISGDGRFALFGSLEDDLVPGDTNSLSDLFVRDLLLGVTTRVNLASGGQEANGETPPYGALSRDGRYVAFSSRATNLVAGDANGAMDIFVHDRLAVVTRRVSVSGTGAESNGDSWEADISADGRHVTFASFASNLAPGDTNGDFDVFVHDTQLGATRLLSRGLSGSSAQGMSQTPRISADGRWIAFTSLATDLVAGDTNGLFDAFLADALGGTIERISVSASGGELSADSSASALSHDGRRVLFSSASDAVVAGDQNQAFDVFLREGSAANVKLVSVSTDGLQGFVGGHSFGRDLTYDGRFACFVGPDELGPSGTFGGILVRGCRQSVTRYGIGMLNSAGCAPWVTWAGKPSASAGSGFVIRAQGKRNQVPGLFFYGFQSNPQPLGYPHVQIGGPIRRIALPSTGGSPSGSDCTGTLQLDFNVRIAAGIDPLLLPGTRVFGQFWSRDPGHAPGSQFGLTDAVDLTIGP